MPDERNSAAKRRGTRNAAASGRRPARSAQRRQAEIRHTAESRQLYEYFLPYVESSHTRHVRTLKAGVWLLFLLPFILGTIRTLTDANRIAFLIVWIFAMFAIAVVLIFIAYADYDLKQTLKELKEIIPPEEEYEIGPLIPIDAEGEGWLINPEDLGIPMPTMAELSKLPSVNTALLEKMAAVREETEQRRSERKEKSQNRTGKQAVGRHEAPSDGKHVKKSTKAGEHAKHLQNH